MNWIDTPLLVYGAVVAHPAKAVIAQELRQGVWGSSVLVLLECYQVLTRDYAVDVQAAAEAVERLARSPLYWGPIEASHTLAAVAQRRQYHLQSTDVVLLAMAREDRGTIVTQDRQLLRAAQAQGVAIWNPISAELQAAITEWEERHLPQKGFARVLGAVERWLRAENPDLAERFLEATSRLSELPS